MVRLDVGSGTESLASTLSGQSRDRARWKLTLKIPWKNLYSDAVVATLDGLYLLVVPGATLKYDAAKEERDQQEAKQKELQRIEEALQKAACRGEEADL
ncbi:Vacuolar protein sorting-associated protein 13C [Liparis tanakae]|uniref:Vacuolar protein sorting-associated protein 13C n=1 Tax=Liparis tanakae TaxID=230148 RepID=A0A4Z2H3Y1_9TELE|nr:Vacuolar protein sorting-associated protein 13C [Liparis tanakae]